MSTLLLTFCKCSRAVLSQQSHSSGLLLPIRSFTSHILPSASIYTTLSTRTRALSQFNNDSVVKYTATYYQNYCMPLNRSSRCYCTDKTPGPPTKKGLWVTFKELWKKYYYVVIPVHLVTSAVWFGTFYYIAASGVDVVAFVENLSFVPDSWAAVVHKIPPSAGNAAVAYALYKIVTPGRYAVTIAGTHFSIRILSRMGLIPTAKQVGKASKAYVEQNVSLETKRKLAVLRERTMSRYSKTRAHLGVKKWRERRKLKAYRNLQKNGKNKNGQKNKEEKID